MKKITERQQTYNKISNTLACMGNKQLEHLLINGKAMHKGIGGSSLQIDIDNTPVFVKKVPLTNLELQPENYMSTANTFNLPMCYQYGIGSTGFGAWRELAAHVMTTNWVISGQCPNFPIMYHWRILKDTINTSISNEDQIALDKDATYWENNAPINSRLKAIALATHHTYLFLEFIPDRLYGWLNKQLSTNENAAINAVRLVENQMQKINYFMGAQNFLHMDTHFENILTDGERLYYSDFGLALSQKFQLSSSEEDFFRENVSYDKASGIVNLLHCLITYMNKSQLLQKTKIVQGIRGHGSTFKSDLNQFKEILGYYINKNISGPIAFIDKVIQNYASVAIQMDEFYCSIQGDKSTKYPDESMQRLLNELV